jgi:hypothetical protein
MAAVGESKEVQYAGGEEKGGLRKMRGYAGDAAAICSLGIIIKIKIIEKTSLVLLDQ